MYRAKNALNKGNWYATRDILILSNGGKHSLPSGGFKSGYNPAVKGFHSVHTNIPTLCFFKVFFKKLANPGLFCLFSFFSHYNFNNTKKFNPDEETELLFHSLIHTIFSTRWYSSWHFILKDNQKIKDDGLPKYFLKKSCILFWRVLAALRSF